MFKIVRDSNHLYFIFIACSLSLSSIGNSSLFKCDLFIYAYKDTHVCKIPFVPLNSIPSINEVLYYICLCEVLLYYL